MLSSGASRKRGQSDNCPRVGPHLVAAVGFFNRRSHPERRTINKDLHQRKYPILRSSCVCPPTQPMSYLHRDHTTVGEQQSRLLGTEQLCLCITCIIVESFFFCARHYYPCVFFFFFFFSFLLLLRSLSDGEAIPCPCRRPNLRKWGGRGPAGSCQLGV